MHGRRLTSRLRDAGVTEREADVLVALDGGLSNAEIARQLFISERTVESHISSLRRKLGVSSRTALCDLGRGVVGRALVPFPAPLARPHALPFVGRRAEREVLVRAWKEVAAGECRTVLIAGEPGIGKTRLAAEVAASLREDEGAGVLYGRCDEDLAVPYQPFVEALRHFSGHISGPDLLLRLGRYAGELVRLAPELNEGCPGLHPPLNSDPETERYRLFDAVAAWLATASTHAPVVLVLDDLHWATKTTLLLARHVVRSPEPMRLLIVGTYRDTELPRHHPLVDLLADLRTDEAVERLALSGLDERGVTEYVEAAAGHELDEEDRRLARTLHAETEGNPFFMGEMLRHLAETGGVARQDGRWMTALPPEDLGIPDGVREVVGRRLSRLSGDANRVLQVAAVIGTEFEFPVVQLVTGDFDEERLLTALDEAIIARLVRETPPPARRHRFAHALVRDTLYHELSGERRLSLHRRVAEAIEEIHAAHLDDYLPALARHYARASSPTTETAKAVAYATRAADRALDLLAHDDAVAYYTQALELLEVGGGTAGEPARVELLIALGEAQRRAGDPAHRQTLLDAARVAEQRREADALARAALANYRGFWSATGTVDTERVDVLEAALRAADPDDSRLRARLLANLGSELQYSGGRARRLAMSDEALQIARRLGDPLTLAHVVLARCSAIWEPATAVERLANTGELLAVADRLGDPAVVAWAWAWRFIAAMDLGNTEEADHSLEQLKRLAEELNQPMLLWVAAYLEVGRVLLAGRLAEAERLAAKARELGMAAGQPDAHLFFGTQRFYTRLDQGCLAEVVNRMHDSREQSGAPVTRALLALAYCELDQDDDARRVFEPLATELAELAVDHRWLETMATSAAVSARLGHGAAHYLLDLLAPYADHIAGTAIAWAGSVSHYLGLLTTSLGRFDEADGYFAAAAFTHERIGAAGWLARTRLEWARMLLIRRGANAAQRAQQLLGQASATARALGLSNVERRVASVGRLSGYGQR
jgi:DNA-binding CsgD family transcriptional regulator/tetratricopeptide (TPR) repeat protein